MFFLLFYVFTVTHAIKYSGINLAGLEFVGVNFTKCTPRVEATQTFTTQGHNVFRIPFSWEKLQPCFRCEFDQRYLAALDRAVQGVLSTGAIVLLDLHNYFRYNGVVLSTSDTGAYTNIWYRLALQYTTNDRIWFGLMNEPHDMTTELVFSLHQQAIWAIRSTGNLNKIIISGNGWDNLAHWADNPAYYGTPNTKLALMDDTANNHMYEMHIYFDFDGSGKYGSCNMLNWEGVQATTNWLRSVGKTAIISEFGLGNNDACVLGYGEPFLQYLNSNSDVYTGYAYWAAGPCWPNNYVFTVDPNNGVASTDSRLQLLSKYSAQISPEGTTQTSGARASGRCSLSFASIFLSVAFIFTSSRFFASE